MVFANIYRISYNERSLFVRTFSSSRTILKNRNKIKLKSLGSILSKGKVGHDDNERKANHDVNGISLPPKTQTLLEDFVDLHAKELEKSSFKVGYMSKDDIKLQEFLDSGRQFGASGSGSVLQRIDSIDSLPEEIDLLKTPWGEIERVYHILKELDNDQGIHYKYKKRLAIDTKNLLAVRNKRLADMCKYARRDQKRQMSSLDSAFESIFQYNVVGFDRSLGGVPLQTGKHAFRKTKTGLHFPVELLEDSQPFETKIPIHKKEVNFMEDDALEETLMPHDVKPNIASDLLSMEGKPIFMENIDNYISLEHMSESLKLKMENEIYNLQRMLLSEITHSTMSLFSSFNKELKRNEYLLVSKSSFATKYTGPTFKYSLKFFELVPFYGSLLATRKHRKNLEKHLYKIIMLNLKEQIDSVTRIKYKSPPDRRAFMDKIHAQVQSLIKESLLPKAFQERLKVAEHVNVVVHKQVSNSNFSRFWWLQKPREISSMGRSRNSVQRRQARYLNITQATGL